jgi:hypothetical protein
MSKEEAAAADEVCASCGQAEIDHVKLKKVAIKSALPNFPSYVMLCSDCDLVKYCRDGCQENHSEQHEEECKKRAAELRDRDLFTQPDISCYGECPICFLPLSIDSDKSNMMPCCSKSICLGCHYANQMREFEAGLEMRCAFCREPAPKSEKEAEKRMMKRIKKNNCPVAMHTNGMRRYHQGDHKTAFEYWTKAAELGEADAHYALSIEYKNGQVVEKDKKKELYHLEEAAIAGHPLARHNLGGLDASINRYDRARKHWIIAANLGCEDSLSNLKVLYQVEKVSKEDYAGALRGYQAAVVATKSPEREKAEEAISSGKMKLF